MSAFRASRADDLGRRSRLASCSNTTPDGEVGSCRSRLFDVSVAGRYTQIPSLIFFYPKAVAYVARRHPSFIYPYPVGVGLSLCDIPSLYIFICRCATPYHSDIVIDGVPQGGTSRPYIYLIKVRDKRCGTIALRDPILIYSLSQRCGTGFRLSPHYWPVYPFLYSSLTIFMSSHTARLHCGLRRRKAGW